MQQLLKLLAAHGYCRSRQSVPPITSGRKIFMLRAAAESANCSKHGILVPAADCGKSTAERPHALE
jgi:hypothetical protein